MKRLNWFCVSVFLVLAGCLPENPIGPPSTPEITRPATDAGPPPAVGSACTGPDVYGNVGCDGRCRESFLACLGGSWVCISIPQGAMCTSVPLPADAGARDAAPAVVDARSSEVSVPADGPSPDAGGDAADASADAVADRADGSPVGFCASDTARAEGSFCYNGVGACYRTGTFRCEPGAFQRTCSAPIVFGTTEVCNGVDDDCDSLLDDGIPPAPCYGGPPSTSVRGTCRPGTQVCHGGAWAACVGEIRPQPEVCGDRLDNDCDGVVDNGCTVVGMCAGRPFVPSPCHNGVGVCQRDGRTVCQGDHVVCAAIAASPVHSIEICGNGLDDNCNGQTDEGPCTNAPP